MTAKQSAHYWNLWRNACLAQGWTPSQGVPSKDVNELRHQQQAAALGYAKSSKDLTNAEFDLVKAHFQLLANDTDLSAAVRLADPEIGERKRLIYSINRLAPEAYRRKVTQDKFHTTDLDQLSIEQLTQLRNTLANRAHKFRKTRSSRREEAQTDPTPVLEENPF